MCDRQRWKDNVEDEVHYYSCGRLNLSATGFRRHYYYAYTAPFEVDENGCFVQLLWTTFSLHSAEQQQ